MSFSYLNKSSSEDERRHKKITHDLHFLEPIANYLKYLQVGFVGIVEPRSIYKDETVTVDWMIVQSDGANRSRAWRQTRACTPARLIGKGVYNL